MEVDTVCNFPNNPPSLVRKTNTSPGAAPRRHHGWYLVAAQLAVVCGFAEFQCVRFPPAESSAATTPAAMAPTTTAWWWWTTWATRWTSPGPADGSPPPSSPVRTDACHVSLVRVSDEMMLSRCSRHGARRAGGRDGRLDEHGDVPRRRPAPLQRPVGQHRHQLHGHAQPPRLPRRLRRRRQARPLPHHRRLRHSRHHRT
jgi:hypothetical protein